MSSGLQRGAIAVAGAAESDLGAVAAGLSPIDMMAQATARALDDAGLRLDEVDGLFAAGMQTRMPTLALAEYQGLHPRWQGGTHIGGSSFMSHLAHAQLAIAAGCCEVVVIAYGSTQRSMGRSTVAVPELNPYESPFRPVLPASAYALAASRHMHLYGTTREQLAEVAVAARQWALLNPKAWEREPLTVDQVLGSRMVSHPLTVRDCCLVTDGGGALVVTSAARARTLRKPPVFVLGFGESLSHQSISNMPDLSVTAARESGAAAYRMAGLGPKDIDVVELYDAFTLCTLLFLEDLGFCAKGEGGAFVASGAIAPGGSLPVNTNGGGLSCVHPGMYGLFTIVEAVRQLRGECGPRQVQDPQIALCHGSGGRLSAQVTALLGTAATL